MTYELYLDYVNNFLSVQNWADYYGLQMDEALEIIKKWRD
jgi:hypothetical protein